MAITLTVNAVDRKSETDFATVRIEERADGIATCSLDIYDRTWAISNPIDLELIIADGSPRLFAGFIREVHLDSKGRTRIYRCRATDYNDLLDEDVIPAPAFRSAVENDKQRVEWLLTTHGTKGITGGSTVVAQLSTMPVGSDASNEPDFGGKTFREALDYIARLAGAAYYVDFNKVLHWFSALNGEGLTAPFNLSDTPNFSSTYPHFGLDYPRRSGDFRNAVFIRGNGISGWHPDPPPGASTRRAGVIRDDEITSTDQLEAAGDAYLAAHAQETSLTAQVLQSGLHVGMAVQMTSAQFNLSAASYMVANIKTRFMKGAVPVYTVLLGMDPPSLASVIGGAQQTANIAIIAAQQAVSAGGEAVADLTVGGANLIPNSSFENASLSGWAVGADWVFGALSATAFHQARVAEGAPVGGTLGNLDTPAIAVDKTDDFWLSVWSLLSSRTSGTAVIEALEYNGSMTLLATTTIASLTAVQTVWTRHSIRFGPNTAFGRTQWQATTAFLRLRARTTGAATLIWDLDAAQLERGKLLSHYAPAPYELIDGQLVGPEFGPGSISGTAIADDSISTPKIQAGAIDTNKLAANAVVAGKIAAGVITSSHIATSGLDADVIKTGTLEIGGVAGAIDFIKVYNSSGQLIAYLDETGFYSLDPLDPDIWVRLNEAGLFLTRDDGATFLTVMDQYGLHADAVEIGIEPGGSNLVPNSGMEIAAFTSPLSKVWTVTADWDDALSQVNLDISGSALNLLDATY